MSYQVLARKWRPRSLDALVGQEHVVTALTNAFSQGRLHHAWLLTGTRGVGKTTMARIMAKMLNCEVGVSANPCGKCRTCLEIDEGRFVDLLEMDAASNTRVDDMREVLDNAQYLPTAGRYKVYLIDEVHMLSRSAFNSMLKTLEEPPEHVKFILATTDPQKIPITVLSRCMQFMLRQLTPSEIAAHLHKILELESLPGEEAALRLLARAAHGSMRDALSLLDQAIAHGGGAVSESAVRGMLGAVDTGWLYDLIEAVAAGRSSAVVEQSAHLAQGPQSADSVLEEMALILHRVALAQMLPAAIPEDLPERVRIFDLAAKMSPDDVQLCYQIALNGRRDLPLAPDEETGLSMTLLRMLAFAPVTEMPQASAGKSAAGFSAASARTTAVPVAAASSREVELQEKLAPREVEPRQVQRKDSATQPFDGDWLSLQTRLDLSGMTRMLAQHCSLMEYTGERIHLVLPANMRHLLSRNYQDRLLAAIHEVVSGAPEVVIAIGDSVAPSAAVLKQQEVAERQGRAQQAVREDSVLQHLRETCAAQVDPASIKPNIKE